MKYYDTFSFFNEIDLLWLRVNHLKELNPIHVLVESTFTHTGDPKPLYFQKHKDKFKGFNIRHIITEEMPNDGDAWANEKYQRNCSFYGTYDANDDDIIGIFDLDEIPTIDSIKNYNPENGIAATVMDKYSYYLNCVECIQCWKIGRLLTANIFKKKTASYFRNEGYDYEIPNAGWHMSFMGGYNKILEKLYAYAHTETLKPELLDNLEYKFESGQSMWGKDFWRFVKIDEAFPKYLYEHQEEFKHLIKEI